MDQVVGPFASKPAWPVTIPMLTIPRLVGEEMVDIYVGPEEVHFRIHKRILCDRVPYFHKMFTSGFKEGSENTARFPEDDPDSFDMLVDWIYFYNIRGLAKMKDSDGNDIITWDPVRFYCLAEKLCLPMVMDNIMDTLRKYHKKMQELPSPDFIYRAYASTSDKSPLRNYCLMTIRYILADLSKDETEEGWPTSEIQKLFKDHDGFASDYITATRDGISGDPRDLPKCFFHVHGDDEPCITNDWNGKRKYYALPQPKHPKRQCLESAGPRASPASPIIEL
jgi:hypothetical protein